jgi:L-ascorbate metabolism protein UlaG (beta-lactamase superfamily)
MFRNKTLWWCAGLLALAATGWTQEALQNKPSFISSPRRLLTAPELPDAPDTWIDNSFRWVDYILETYPPSIEEFPARRAALIRLDDILHIESAPRKAIVQRYYRHRLESAIEEIENTKVTQGMRIWKLYNHGFLVRTPTVSFTVDIVPGVVRVPEFSLPQDLMQRLVSQSDATFISHLHNDHANQQVARMFLAQHKPVIAPEGLWSETADLAAGLTYPKRSTDVTHSVPLKGGSQALKVVAYPGHQSKSPIVNVHLITTPEGYTVVHTGDQSGFEGPGGDFDWIAQIGRDHVVDALMVNCWTNELGRVIRGVNPELVITGHENEMGHTVDHREDYTQTYNHLFEVRYPFVLMTWGESYLYLKSPVRGQALSGIVHN